MQILRLSIYTGRRRSFVITYLSKKKYCARLCIYTESFICEVLFVYVEILIKEQKSLSSEDEICDSDSSVSNENDPIEQDCECTSLMKTKEKNILI